MAQMKVDDRCAVCGMPLVPGEDAILITKVSLSDELSGNYSKRHRPKLENDKLRVIHYGRVNPRCAVHVDCISLKKMCLDNFVKLKQEYQEIKNHAGVVE